jgi:hypothetical protein
MELLPPVPAEPIEKRAIKKRKVRARLVDIYFYLNDLMRLHFADVPGWPVRAGAHASG